MNLLTFAKPNYALNSNTVIRNKYSLYYIPFITIINYFFWNYENIYFLVLAIFQLATLKDIIPKDWSPTGPYSTSIPLLLCIMIDLLTNFIKWVKNWKLDHEENNKKFLCLTSGQHTYKKSKDIYPGDVIVLKKDDVVPVDGIIIAGDNEKYSRISLSLLTGESNIHYVI
jgi:magnesium-transporting ATPase (P-type)